MLYPTISLQPTHEAQHLALLELCRKWPALVISPVDAPVKPTVETPTTQTTLEVVRAKLTQLARDGKAETVKALLAKHGAASVTQLAPAHYAAILAEAGATC